MTIYNLFKKGVTTATSFLGSAAGFVESTPLLLNTVPPITRCLYRHFHGAPSGVVAAWTEKFIINSALSATLPYAPYVCSTVGGMAGLAATSAAFYAAEKIAEAGANCYEQSQRKKQWAALARNTEAGMQAILDDYDIVEETPEAGNWVNFVSKAVAPVLQGL